MESSVAYAYAVNKSQQFIKPNPCKTYQRIHQNLNKKTVQKYTVDVIDQ